MKVVWEVEHAPTFECSNGATSTVILHGPSVLLSQSSAYGFTLVDDTLTTPVNPIALQSGIRTYLPHNNGQVVRDRLKFPFAGHQFIQNGNFTPRVADEAYTLNINFTVVSDTSENIIAFALDIGGVFNAIERVPAFILSNAGVPVSQSLSLDYYAAETFLANGGSLFATANAYAEITQMGWLILPRSTP